MTRLGGNVVPETTDQEHAEVGPAKIHAKKVLVLDSYGNQVVDFGTRWWSNDIEEVGTLTYIGKEDSQAEWYIQKIDSASGTTIRYASIKNNVSITNYSDAWSNRNLLTYGTYSQAFS
jgi:hypothetical protein